MTERDLPDPTGTTSVQDDAAAGARHAHDLHRQAADLLDRLPVVPADPAPWRAPLSPTDTARATPLLVFRIGDEWLALPAAAIEEVAQMRGWHTIPGHRQRTVLGLVNLRGALVPCLSLGELLGVQPTAAAPPSTSSSLRSGTARLLALRHGAHLSAFPVTEVHGTVTPEASSLGTVPATSMGAADGFARAVMRWRERVVGVLDPVRVGAAFDRSLA